MKTECSTPKRPVLIGKKENSEIVYMFQPRCKMWKCPSCATINRLLWQAKIGHGFEWYSQRWVKDWRFITITAREYDDTEEKCLAAWRKGWGKLSTRMRREYPGIRYVLLPEHHEDGRIHWHMIASGGVTERWLKDNAPSCRLGYMNDSEPVYNQFGAIMYVSKYVSKSCGIDTFPRGLRRVRTSQKWPELPPGEDQWNTDEIEWSYLHSYYADGLTYLAHEYEAVHNVTVEVLKS